VLVKFSTQEILAGLFFKVVLYNCFRSNKSWNAQPHKQSEKSQWTIESRDPALQAEA